MEGPINSGDINQKKDRLPYPWNQELDHGAFERAKLKNEFLSPFNDEEVITGFNQPLREMENPDAEIGKQRMDEIYQRVYGDLVYQILKVNEKNSQSMDLFFDLSKEDGSVKSELIFRSLSSPIGNGFNLAHRIIKTQQEGIGGSSFLKKAEEYLAILKKNNLIECNWIAVESAQPNVTEFFLKNGYHILTDGNSTYERHLSNPEDFEMIDIDFIDNPVDRDPTPVLKEAFDNPEFMNYFVNDNGKQKFKIDFHEMKKFEKYFPKVILGKDM